MKAILRLYSTFLVFFLATFGTALRAQTDTPVPHFFSFQGELTGADANYTAAQGYFKFALVHGTTTVSVYWKNDNNQIPVTGQTPVTEPATAVTLPVTAGSYGIFLGTGATLYIPYVTFTVPDLRVRTWFSRTGVAGSFVVQPDTLIPAAPYAIQIPDNTITNAKIAAGAVTSTQIANGAVGAGKLGTNAVIASNIAPGAINISSLQTPTAPVIGQLLSYNGTTGLAWTPNIWALNGSSGLAFYNFGNVGIGTANPASKLTVIGGPQWTANGWLGSFELSSASAIGWEPDTSGVSFGFGHTNGAFYAFHTLSAPGNPSLGAVYDFTITNTGNVGIGTTTPVSKLDIRGAQDALHITGYQPVFTMYDTSTGNKRGAIQAVGGDVDLFTEAYLSGANPYAFFKLGNNGRVGIGSPVPASNLDVHGTGITESGVTSVNERAVVSLNSTIGGTNRVWTLESGVGGTSGLFGIFDRQAGRARLTIDTGGVVSVAVLQITGGADLAEPFKMKEEKLEKGSVVVIDGDHPGRLKRSSSSYDTRVAGIVSGANGVNPGISLHQEGVMDGEQNVALSGRVYVMADSSNGPIRPGDMLTTSDTPGHAMKVTDHAKAQGAIIGKAMGSLDKGEGMVLVLVTLQ